MSNDSLRTLKLNLSANVKNRTVTSPIFRRVSVPLTEYEYAAISIDVMTARHSAFENCLRFSTQYSTHECFSCSRVDDFNTSRSSDLTTFMVLPIGLRAYRLSNAFGKANPEIPVKRVSVRVTSFFDNLIRTPTVNRFIRRINGVTNGPRPRSRYFMTSLEARKIVRKPTRVANMTDLRCAHCARCRHNRVVCAIRHLSPLYSLSIVISELRCSFPDGRIFNC